MIHIITVNYKQEKYLIQIVDIVKKRNDTYLTIVDNSKSFNKNLCTKNINYFTPNANIGYLQGLSLGIEKSKIKTEDIVILCNPDIEVNDSFLNDIKNISNLNNNDLIAPSIIDANKKNQNPNKLKKFSKVDMFLSNLEFKSFLHFIIVRFIRKVAKSIVEKFKKMPININEAVCEIFLPHGSCMIFKGAFFKEQPYFDYNVFLWGEEAIIADKVRKKGGKVIFYPLLTVHHQASSSTKHISSLDKYKIWKKSYKVYRELLY